MKMRQVLDEWFDDKLKTLFDVYAENLTISDEDPLGKFRQGFDLLMDAWIILNDELGKLSQEE